MPACIKIQKLRLQFQAIAIADVVQSMNSSSIRVIGHSYGGSVAIKLSQELMARGLSVEALVLYEANCFHLLPNNAPGEDGKHRATIKELIEAKLHGDHDAFGTLFADLWWGGGWDEIPERARVRLIRMLEAMPAEATMLLNEDADDINAALACLGKISNKHYIYGGSNTAKMIAELARFFKAEVGFETFSFPAETGIAHMGPQSHPDQVLPLLIERAGM